MKCHVSEYDCWFQKRQEPLPADWAGLTSTVIGTGKAADEFVLGMSRVFGIEPHRITGAGEKSGGGTWIGLIAALNRDRGVNLPPQKSEGFVIRVSAGELIIAGQDEAGCLYGVYRLLSMLAQRTIHLGAELAEAPQVPFRIINHWDEATGFVGRGYAGPSLFFKDDRLSFDPARIEDYARLLASVGINCLSINNVNVKGGANKLITAEGLPETARLAAIFRPFGVRLLLSVNFAAPYVLQELDTADPLDPAVAAWWKKQTDLVYQHIPDLAGFVVKADSEGEPGPFQYHRTHADGANMLAAALEPHGGTLFWRCFVYNCTQDWRDQTMDRARAAYDHFMPQDGSFSGNVVLQIKFGPYDFQVREPVSPLFGALKKTRHIMELQVTQEYTGHQIDLCYLPWIWEDIMGFDTAHGNGGRIRELMGTDGGIEGLAAVGNVGLDKNWTGHTLAQANFYGYGRLCWNPRLTAREIAREWTTLTFNRDDVAVATADILLRSYPAYEKYNAPFGVCFMVTPGLHYGPNIEGYEFSRWGTYHRADQHAIGIDRTPSGTGYTDQYAPKNAAIFADPAKCPENLILFFHRLRYEFRMKNGETLLQNIYSTHFEGYDEAATILEKWKALEGQLDGDIYASVLSRMERQLLNAREWRDQVNTYFWRRTGIPDRLGRKIYN